MHTLQCSRTGCSLPRAGEDQSPEGGSKGGRGAPGSPHPAQPIPQRTPLRVGGTHTHARARPPPYPELAHAECAFCRPGGSSVATSSPGPRPAPSRGQAAVSRPGDRGRGEVTGSRSARPGSTSAGRPAQPRGWRSRRRASPPPARPHLGKEDPPLGFRGSCIPPRSSLRSGRQDRRQGALPLSPPGVPTRSPTSRAHWWGPRATRDRTAWPWGGRPST